MEASSARNIACFALLVAILALQVPPFIDPSAGGTTTTTTTAAAVTESASASAPPPHFDGGALKAVAAVLALAGMDAVLIATAVIYYSRRTHHAAAAAGIGGNWRVSELAFFILCLQVGVLQFVLFVKLQEASAAAAGALPFVASVTFFLGITLIYAAHARVGNAAGGAVDGNGPMPAPATIRLLANMTLGAAFVCLVTIVLALLYINTK